jgi:hypothetical protein
MGYIEWLISGSFKTTEDGRRLFFPWGVFGRGYAIASEENYWRLRQQVKAYSVVILLVMIVTPGYTITVALEALLVALYLAWMWVLLPRLQAADEGLSLRESITSQARAHGPVLLWLLNIVSLAFVVNGTWLFIVEPGRRLVWLAVILFFGLCAAIAIRMLWQQAAGAES